MIMSTIILGFTLLVVIRLRHKLKQKIRENSSRHFLHMLRRVRIEFILKVDAKKCNNRERAWIESYETFINSAITFLDECINHGIYSSLELEKYIGNNAKNLVSARDKRFAEIINNELSFIPLHVKKPFPEQLDSIEESINEAIEYSNELGNPFSRFLQDHLYPSKKISANKIRFRASRFRTSFNMGFHNSTIGHS